jgi:hypothetical protein
MLLVPIIASLVAGPQAGPGPQNDWIIPTGVTVAHRGGEIQVRDLVIEEGATLRINPDAAGLSDPIVGTPPIPQPLRLRASGTIRIEGTLDISGARAFDVSVFNAANRRQFGGRSTSGGQVGGTGNPVDWDHCPAGNPGGVDQFEISLTSSGRGGESGVSTASASQSRPGGGGGGAFAADQPVHADPNNDLNIGRIAQPGHPGGPAAFGAVTLASPPPGGAAGLSVFVDGQAATDFFGIRMDPITHQLTNGELLAPTAGFGGGGGGNRITGTTFPPSTPWSVGSSDTQIGAGGGAGGGLVILEGVFIVLGPNGRIVCDGGAGGSGENTNGLNRIGGGGGGGSGGMILMQARRVDLRQASANAITALGGRGGRGAGNVFGATCAGGNGGPGLIQIHVPNELTNLVLPQGVTLAQITAPTAFVCLPVQGL